MPKNRYSVKEYSYMQCMQICSLCKICKGQPFELTHHLPDCLQSHILLNKLLQHGLHTSFTTSHSPFVSVSLFLSPTLLQIKDQRTETCKSKVIFMFTVTAAHFTRDHCLLSQPCPELNVKAFWSFVNSFTNWLVRKKCKRIGKKFGQILNS